MSSIKTVPVTWVVNRLMCDCGGEFYHKFSIKYKAKPFVHVCEKCSATEDTESIYPMTTYQQVYDE